MTYVVSVVRQAGMIGWVVLDVRPVIRGVTHYKRRLEADVRREIDKRPGLRDGGYQLEIRERTDP